MRNFYQSVTPVGQYGHTAPQGWRSRTIWFKICLWEEQVEDL